MPLRLGDLVEYQKDRWYVTKRNHGVRTVILRKFDLTGIEIADNDPDCKVIANPPRQWPFISAPRHPKAGLIERITISRKEGPKLLVPMHAWVPSEALHNGGVIYFHPNLKLRPGEVLVARHRTQTLTRLNVTQTFGNVQRRLALDAAKREPPAPQTRYDYLLIDDEEL